jgi:class 3 adenylate cyclase
MIGSGGIALVLLLVVIGLTYQVIYQWHDQERQLAESSEQLSRANDIISRYVASQLVSEVQSGGYEALNRRERRKLTLFFSDIEDFAATADLTEPEDLAAVLNEYLAEMTAIGKRYGATIDKFVGDAIMIFFGAPVATSDEDHALRAVQMASEMQDRMSALQVKWRRQGFERPFHIRIGINTGHANIGNFGSAERMDYTAIGRQVNLAARLQSHCEPGKILISHSTWVLVQDDVTCTPKGEIQVKGFHQPVRVYEVTGSPFPSEREEKLRA